MFRGSGKRINVAPTRLPLFFTRYRAAPRQREYQSGAVAECIEVSTLMQFPDGEHELFLR